MRLKITSNLRTGAYLIKKVVGPELLSAATDRPPFGPGFTTDQAQKADRMEIWGSSFEDAGGDSTTFKLYKGAELLATKNVMGF